jgi:FtsH-binding integral membrane protein
MTVLFAAAPNGLPDLQKVYTYGHTQLGIAILVVIILGIVGLAVKGHHEKLGKFLIYMAIFGAVISSPSIVINAGKGLADITGLK